MERIVKVGKMPGRITEVAVPVGATVAEVLALSELDANGFEIKVDGNVGGLDTKVTETTSLILLAQMVKGNK